MGRKLPFSTPESKAPEIGVLASMRHVGGTFYQSLLKQCAARRMLAECSTLHGHMLRTGFLFDKLLINTLIQIYGKCRRPEDARKVFEEVTEPNVFSWTILMATHAKNPGIAPRTLQFYCRMKMAGVAADKHVLTTVATACAESGTLEAAKQIHADVWKLGYVGDTFVCNSLISMYCKCRMLDYACQVFDEMQPDQLDVVSWNSLITGCVYGQEYEKGLGILRKMVEFPWSREIPDRETYLGALCLCGGNGLLALNQGNELHARVIKLGLQDENDVVLGNAILNMYVKCEQMGEALKAFDRMPLKDVAVWNTLISGVCRSGFYDDFNLRHLFSEMLYSGLRPDGSSFASLLQASAKAGDIRQGMQIHEQIIISAARSESDTDSNCDDIFIAVGLIDMYSKCGDLESAFNVFDEACSGSRNLATWNAMLVGYSCNGRLQDSLAIFQRMLQSGIRPDGTSFVSLLALCTGANLEHAVMQIHGNIVKSGLEADVFIGSALIDSYGKCGSLKSSVRVFEVLPCRNTVSWTIMISRYAQSGHFPEAIDVFQQMKIAGVQPDYMLFAAILSACAKFGALDYGIEFHGEIIRSGCHHHSDDGFVSSALIDMYAKCGDIDQARVVFNRIQEPNTVTWTSMIAGYAMHGFGREAVQLFDKMLHSGIIPDRVAWLSLLSACCHAGMVEQGLSYFEQMIKSCSGNPGMEHYSCMVDLLGRAGLLEEAIHFIHRMPIKPDITVWRALLAACRLHNNMELGESVANHVISLQVLPGGSMPIR